MPSLRTLYEEVQAKRLSVKVIVAGHLLNPRPREISYDFSFGEVPTCDMTLRNQPIPIWLKRNATVQVYVGFNDVLTMTFNGYVSEITVYHDGVHVGCVGSMSKLDSPY